MTDIVLQLTDMIDAVKTGRVKMAKPITKLRLLEAALAEILQLREENKALKTDKVN